MSKVWIEKSDGEHSRLLLLFTTSSRKREHVWREFGGVPEGNFLLSDFLHGLGQERSFEILTKLWPPSCRSRTSARDYSVGALVDSTNCCLTLSTTIRQEASLATRSLLEAPALTFAIIVAALAAYPLCGEIVHSRSGHYGTQAGRSCEFLQQIHR